MNRGISISKDTLHKISDLVMTYNVRILERKPHISDVVKSYVENNQSEDPFLLVNLSEVVQRYEKWVHHLPQVKPYYAMKVNPDPVITQMLHRLGCRVDCATKREIQKALDFGLRPDEIIYANPCRMVGMLKFAEEKGVDLLTFDTTDELHKIKMHHPKARLLVRIKVDDKDSMIKLSGKFGATIKEAKEMMVLAKELDLNIIGVCFHVGSPCRNPYSFTSAIADSRELFDYGTTLGLEMSLLDIGGGFPGSEEATTSFETLATSIKQALDEHFKEWPGLEVIAEPGRYFVMTTHTLVTQVLSKRLHLDEKTNEMSITYFLNDGIYGSFFNVYLDHFVVGDTNTFLVKETENGQKYRSRIYGPTCDSLDLVSDCYYLPELNLGDYLYTINMGAYAYTMAPGTETFNGFDKTKLLYFIH